jgi:hypothetical protein
MIQILHSGDEGGICSSPKTLGKMLFERMRRFGMSARHMLTS